MTHYITVHVIVITDDIIVYKFKNSSNTPICQCLILTLQTENSVITITITKIPPLTHNYTPALLNAHTKISMVNAKKMTVLHTTISQCKRWLMIELKSSSLQLGKAAWHWEVEFRGVYMHVLSHVCLCMCACDDDKAGQRAAM